MKFNNKIAIIIIIIIIIIISSQGIQRDTFSYEVIPYIILCYLFVLMRY